jgi:hypothetical protein
VEQFKAQHLPFLDEFQKAQLKEIIAIDSVMKHVTFTVRACEYGPVSLTSQKPEDIEKRRLIMEAQEKREVEKEQIMRDINRAINHTRGKVVL